MRRAPAPPAEPEDWIDTEQPVRYGLVAELQRIRRRTAVRPWRVIICAALLTALIGHKVAVKKPMLEADVVLSLSEGMLASRYSHLPIDQLRDYVNTVLLPDPKLATLIERRNLIPLRKKQGMQFAIEQLRSQFDITIWKNTFTSYDVLEEEQGHSARIGIAVSDTDPTSAYELAQDLAGIIIDTAAEQRRSIGKQLADQVSAVRTRLEARLVQISRTRAMERQELDAARAIGNGPRAYGLQLDLAQLDADEKTATLTIGAGDASRDSIADQIAAAGLDVTVSVVEEHKPQVSDHQTFVLGVVVVVVGFFALFGTALILGAFDARVHDTDDVERLGLSVLGHLPGFPGDHVGSLDSRSVAGRRVPLFSRWRSHR